MKPSRLSQKYQLLLVLFLVIPAVGMVTPSESLADGLEKASGVELAQIVHGGLLYDKWYAEINVKAPKETHPSYVNSKGKRKGSGTWRCKECHGWDYSGKDGAYASGSHFSGITGIRAASGGSMSDVVASLKGEAHQLGAYIPDTDMEAIAAFVVKGQLDMNRYIERKTKKALGNAENGARIYLTLCNRCHGADGKKINFGNEKKPVFIGTVANKNPWETLHKIRMGQPDDDMPAMLAFPVQTQVDVVAFSQSLPK